MPRVCLTEVGYAAALTRIAALALPVLLAACVVAPAGRTPASPVVAAPVPPPAASSPADFVLRGEARQGGMFRGTVPAGTRTLNLDGKTLPFDPDGYFLIAFDRDAPSEAVLRAERADGSAVERRLTVRPGSWRIEHVDASPTGGVTSAEFRARRAGELERIAAARAVNARSGGWRQDFDWPLTGRVSGLFGAQRIYRGAPGSYHSGIDIAAKAGTPFVAPADGVVVLAAQTPFTLEGHLLIVDHGMGLTSAFLHCASLAVREGQAVRRGEVLGTVGASGRASGPHLHWGLVWRGARLDPLLITGPMPAR